MPAFDIALRGPQGEPVDLRRTISSHGLTSLPPFEPLHDERALRATVPLRRGRPRTIEIHPRGERRASIEIVGRGPGAATVAEIEAIVRRILSLDRDLSGFYAVAAEDPDLAWAAKGAGRWMRSPTVFEDVIKTVCTTNCAWSATVRMVSALVEHLGSPAPGAPKTGWGGRAFPTPAAMAEAGEDFYRDVVRAGYRGRYFVQLSEAVATGELDLEALGAADAEDLPDEELDRTLQALPGVGPYASANIMMVLGRNSRLILDSWTRPTYARLVGKRAVADATIVRRFKPYGRHAGLAFWLFLTRSWVPEPLEAKN
ncbi:MAG: DNA-3-methyladenine glycosylase family protein [Actinomycetota bacterium]